MTRIREHPPVSLAGTILASAAMPAAAQSLGDMADTAAADLAQVPVLISAVIYIAGIVLIIIGIYRFRKIQGGESFWGAAGVVLVGVALLVLPWVFDLVAGTFGAQTTGSIAAPTLQ